jgi:cytochrome c peroxidase
MVSIMAEHQTPQGALSDEELSQLVAFLASLTGEIPMDYIAKPQLPESGERTPPPDPT